MHSGSWAPGVVVGGYVALDVPAMWLPIPIVSPHQTPSAHTCRSGVVLQGVARQHPR